MVEMRKRTLLIVLAVLVFGLVGTCLSILYKQSGWVDFTGREATFRVSYGFPLGWYGHSHTEGGPIPVYGYPETYWFSLGSFLLDAVFWVAISFFVCIATMKSVKVLSRKDSQRQ
jgi:drug/metabolite transporter (DMT)-like permease